MPNEPKHQHCLGPTRNPIHCARARRSWPLHAENHNPWLSFLRIRFDEFAKRLAHYQLKNVGPRDQSPQLTTHIPAFPEPCASNIPAIFDTNTPLKANRIAPPAHAPVHPCPPHPVSVLCQPTQNVHGTNTLCTRQFYQDSNQQSDYFPIICIAHCSWAF